MYLCMCDGACVRMCDMEVCVNVCMYVSSVRNRYSHHVVMGYQSHDNSHVCMYVYVCMYVRMYVRMYM